jgi:hypothetical protein
MRNNNILVPEHFGFRKSLSTENAGFKLTDNVLKAINKNCILEEYSVIGQKQPVSAQAAVSTLGRHCPRGRLGRCTGPTQ